MQCSSTGSSTGSRRGGGTVESSSISTGKTPPHATGMIYPALYII